jgi:quercetin dioxygenase-like cupin family protein
MKLGRKWMFAGVAVAVGVGVGSAPALATPSTSTSTVLAKSTVAPTLIVAHGRTTADKPWVTLLHTIGLTDGYVVDNKFEPGQTSGWHSHPGPSLIFVVAGTVTNYESSDPTCAGKSYATGTSFVDEGGSDVHMLRNNGSVTAETIAVQFLPGGQPRRIDKPEPANCHV